MRAIAVPLDQAGATLAPGGTVDRERAWRALLEGRVRIVERFVADGRVFLVTSRVGGDGTRGALTTRERQVVERRVAGQPLKGIAFELGITLSTVAKALKRALGKLGFVNQTELVRVFGAGRRPKK